MTSMLSTEIVPSSGVSRPATSRIRVVLPAPSGPIRPVTIPRLAAMLTPSSACTVRPLVWNLLVTEFSSNAGSMDFRVSAGMILFSASQAVNLIGRRYGLIERQRHRCRHPEPQFVPGVAGVNADFVDQTRAEFRSLDAFGGEFRRRRDVADPAPENLARIAVRGYRGFHAKIDASHIGFRNIGAHPKRVRERHCEGRHAGRSHVTRLQNSIFDHPIRVRVKPGAGQVDLG